MMIEMYQLRQLVAIADCGNLSKAAEQLHLSQPALSRTMKKLEDLLGVPLFERGKNKIEMNENGRLAVEYAHKVLEDADLLVERVRAFDESQRTISVCSCAPSPLWMLIPALSELYPNMKISSEMKYHDNFLNELTKKKCHLLVMPEAVDNPEIKCTKLFEEQLYLSVPPAHPFSGYFEISLQDLEGETMLLFHDLGYWSHIHNEMKNTRFIFQQELDSLTELIKVSALPAFTSSLIIPHDTTPNRIYIPITDESAKVTFYCCYRKDDAKRFKELKIYLQNRNQELPPKK